MKSVINYDERQLKLLMQDANGELKKKVMLAGRDCEMILKELHGRRAAIVNFEAAMGVDNVAFHDVGGVDEANIEGKMMDANGCIKQTMVLDGHECKAIYDELQRRRALIKGFEDFIDIEPGSIEAPNAVDVNSVQEAA